MTPSMSAKPFPWKCGHCRKLAVRPATIAYVTAIEHDGRTHSVTLPALQVPRCTHCGELVLDSAANRQISDALRRQLGLLAPEQIQSNRVALGLTVSQLADQLGVSEAAMARWESGVQLQSRALDRLLRLFFAFADVRSALGAESELAELGVRLPA